MHRWLLSRLIPSSPEPICPPRIPEKTAKDARTFRVRGVPLGWDADCLQSFLEEQDGLGGAMVSSLALEIHGRSSSGTVTFRDVPAALKALRPEKTWDLALRSGPGMRCECLSLDADFLGMTTLFAPPDEDHRVDLPYDLRSEANGQLMVRIMTYGYESAVAGSRSIQNLEDLATSLQTGLRSLVAGPTSRPVIFVAHSLGGLIVLISLAKSEDEDDKKLMQAIYGIVFFGVPHDGMDISSLIPMVGDGPNRFLIESISQINSQILPIQRREFHTALGDKGRSEIVCFYETMKSPTAQKDEKGNWRMNGPPAVLVSKTSATHCRSWEDGPEHICAVARTHSEMVKFGRNDHDYENVRERLRGIAHRAVAGRRRRQALGTKSYVFWLSDACPDVSVFWVHGSSREHFRQSFMEIAQKCQIPGFEDPKLDVLPLVKDWLVKTQGPWLMVIDNADDTDLFFGPSGAASDGGKGNLGQFLPECSHGALLITTRNKQTGVKLAKGQPPIDVGRMEEEECQSLLRARLEGVAVTAADLSTLSDRLERLPLALVQAAAFIHENSITVQDYLELQDESDQSLVDLLSEEFETVGRDSETPRAVAQTWMLSFQQIQRQNPFAGELLSLMSRLDRQGIPEAFISNYGERNNRFDGRIELVKAVGVLKAFSFMSEEKGGNLNMHRLVQLVTRKWLTKEGTAGRYDREALLTVSEMYPFGNFETRAICSAYLPHANAVLSLGICASEEEAEAKAKASLLHRMAGYLNFEGKWSDAERFSLQAGQIMKKLLGEENPKTLISMNNLASTYSGQGRWKEAEELKVRVLETRKRVLGEDHPNTLTRMNNLASTYREQGRWKEAEELKVRVLEKRNRVLGEDHPNTLASMYNLASTYWSQGRWKEAEELEVRVLETSKRVLGEDHPNTLNSIADLASMYWSQGRWKEAEELEVRVLETRKRALGEDHPDTLVSMHSLAWTWHDSDRRDKAIRLMEDCVRRQQQILGHDHPDTQSSESLLKSWQEDFGRSV
ncbi:hypothetical protein DL767_007448 [Monosporascus sp. MG133]|nr:hypothetical protein DL767_007448 [Monosporascus sp. MG133]